MTYKENIKAILECSFAGFKEEIIDSACNRILEQEPCDDAINREDALMCLTGEIKDTDTIETIIARFVRRIRKLPPANTQPKEMM